MDNTYNGWPNYQTWNVALWLQNDYPLHCIAQNFRTRSLPYLQLRLEVKESSINYLKTGDNVSLWDRSLDIGALDEMLREV